MCLIALAQNAHPDFELILAANRDEYFAREALPAKWWAPQGMHGNRLLAGKDVKGGGTWLGVTASGRWAALTNIRRPDSLAADASKPSRGNLVLNVLSAGDLPPKLAQAGGTYSGFNLLAGDLQQAWHIDNHSLPQALGQGRSHGLSNASLNTPWPKTTHLTSALQDLLSGSSLTRQELHGGLKVALKDQTHWRDESLPNTGIGLEKERYLGPAFIRAPEPVGYGTRVSTLFSISKGIAVFEECTWDTTQVSPKILSERYFEWRLEPADGQVANTSATMASPNAAN